MATISKLRATIPSGSFRPARLGAGAIALLVLSTLATVPLEQPAQAASRGESAPQSGPTAPAGQDMVVFSDALAQGVEDRSWAVHDLHETVTVASGTAAIWFEPDAFRALAFHFTTPVSIANFTALEFWVNGGAVGGQSLRVALFDGDRDLGTSLLRDLVGAPIPMGRWQKVRVQLPSSERRGEPLPEDVASGASKPIASPTSLAGGGAPSRDTALRDAKTKDEAAPAITDVYIQGWSEGDQAKVYVDDVKFLTTP